MTPTSSGVPGATQYAGRGDGKPLSSPFEESVDSLYVEDESFNASTEMNWAESSGEDMNQNDQQKGSYPSGGGAPYGGRGGNGATSSEPRRDSVVMKPVGFGGLLGTDFDDVDYDDSDDDVGQPNPPTTNGDPNHRPMVGGFAAASYEAAREYHLKNQGKAGNKKSPTFPNSGAPPPPSF